MAKKAASRNNERNADVKSVLAWLEDRGSKRAREELGPRYGIWTERAFGVAVGELRKMAKEIGTDHDLAAKLWATGWHDARMLATMIDDPTKVTSAQMDAWCKDFDNWGIVDTASFCLFDRTAHPFIKVKQWAGRKPEFEKRASFALLASLALHDRNTGDEVFLKCFPLIESAADDERNFVKKGVSWALRAIGGRGAELHAAALTLARQLAASENPAARWVGKDALKDLIRPLVLRRIAMRKPKKK